MLKRLRLCRSSKLSLGSLAQSAAEVHGDRPAHRFLTPLPYPWLADEGISYREVNDFVGRAAAVLQQELGVQPGERVILCTSNRIDFFYWMMACSAAGAVPIPTNPQYKARELAHIARDSGAKVLLTEGEIYRATLRRRTAVPGIERWASCGSGPLPKGFVDLLKPMAEIVPLASPHHGDPDAVAGIFYTSGTTGLPKGVLLSHRALLSHLALAALWPPIPGELALSALPIAHIMGFVTTLTAFISGVCLLHMERFRAQDVLEAISRERATVFAGVPTMYRRMEECGAADYDLRSVRAWFSAADVMPTDMLMRFKSYGRLLPLPGRLAPESAFVEGYGMVELAGGAMLRLSLPGRNPTGSGFVGLPIPPWRARVTSEDGQILRRGQTGQLEIRGPGLMQGYLGDQNSTEQTLRDGWLRTGDLAWRDRLGFFHFSARAKDVVKSGGYSVFPAEVEALLCTHPEVQQAVVFGVPHPQLGAAAVAAVVLKAKARLTEAALLTWAREQMADYKAPRHVFFVLEGELPEGPTRKVLRKELVKLHEHTFSSPAG